MNVSKPRPSDHPVLIVFVIGGVTVTEARQIQEVVSATKSNMQVRDTSLFVTVHIIHFLDIMLLLTFFLEATVSSNLGGWWHVG